jgi:hypothetical protein
MLNFIFLSLAIGCIGQTGTISGYVFERYDKTPTPYVEVWLVDTKIASYADSTGYFKIEKIPEGIYNVRFHSVGRKDTVIYKIKVTDNEIVEISTSLGYCKFDRSIHNKTCPVCNKTNKVIPLIYGFPTKKAFRKEKRGKYKLGGDGITDCNPNWYCKRDKLNF